MRSGARVLALALGGLVLAGLVAEAAARRYLGRDFVPGAWVGPPLAICGRFDAQLGWVNREGTRARLARSGGAAGSRGEYTVTIDSLGLRGPERSRVQPAGVVRVLLLGDETSWGIGVGENELFAALVERALAPGVELVNLSVPGYSTDQELLLLEREGARHAPDLVLLALVHDDLVANELRSFQGLSKPFFELAEDGSLRLEHGPLAPPARGWLHSGGHALRRLSAHSALARLALGRPAEPARADLAGIDADWDRLADPSSRSSRLLEALRARCEELGAPLHAFVLPHGHDRWLLDAALAHPSGLPLGGEALTRASLRLAEAGERLGIVTFSVDRALLEESRAGHRLEDGEGFLNARGHRAVAVALAEHLRRALRPR